MSAASRDACDGERTTGLAQVRFIARVVPNSVAKESGSVPPVQRK